jgi:hypothetical protein
MRITGSTGKAARGCSGVRADKQSGNEPARIFAVVDNAGLALEKPFPGSMPLLAPE